MSPRTPILLLHPGAMGVTIGAALTASGQHVRWCAADRGPVTAARAASACLTRCDDLHAGLDGAGALVAVCPPHAALAVAKAVAATGWRGTYVDANAIAPATARAIADVIGAGYVDGGIIGPPASRPGTTRLYLSGSAADEVRGWFTHGALGVEVLGEGASDASALKMCYAAYTKGSSALLLAVCALAEAHGVAGGLRAEWARSQPGLSERAEATARAIAGKAWRFTGEMEEIAATFAAVDLPPGFHDAAARLYARLAPLKDQPAGLGEVLRRLVQPDVD